MNEVIKARIEALEDELLFYNTGLVLLTVTGLTHIKSFPVLEKLIESAEWDLAMAREIASEGTSSDLLSFHEQLFNMSLEMRAKDAKEAGLPVYENE